MLAWGAGINILRTQHQYKERVMKTGSKLYPGNTGQERGQRKRTWYDYTFFGPACGDNGGIYRGHNIHATAFHALGTSRKRQKRKVNTLKQNTRPNRHFREGGRACSKYMTGLFGIHLGSRGAKKQAIKASLILSTSTNKK